MDEKVRSVQEVEEAKDEKKERSETSLRKEDKVLPPLRADGGFVEDTEGTDDGTHQNDPG